eukprot:775724-Pyramimonas_sp.AAC.1
MRQSASRSTLSHQSLCQFWPESDDGPRVPRRPKRGPRRAPTGAQEGEHVELSALPAGPREAPKRPTRVNNRSLPNGPEAS